MVVEYAQSLAPEAKKLSETLNLRLCKQGVRVILGQCEQSKKANEADCPPKSDVIPGVRWIVHLRDIPDDSLLIAIDQLNESGDSNEDLVRKVPLGPDVSATAWTLALMVENAVLPYLERSAEQPALGAGLAIIEPPEVGGTLKKQKKQPQQFPTFHAINVGIESYYLGATRSFIAGPRLGVSGMLSPRLMISFSAGWAGIGRYQRGDIEGTVSHAPLDLLFGFMPYSGKVVSASVQGGVSVGFSIYHSSLIESGSNSRIDVLFNPWVRLGAEVAFHIYGPIAISLNGGAAVPLMKDVLQNSSVDVYRQNSVLPYLGADVQLWF